MITLQLEQEDLVNLVLGVSPNYSIMDYFLNNELGELRGTHTEFQWNTYKLKEKTEKELRDIYFMCKNSWKK